MVVCVPYWTTIDPETSLLEGALGPNEGVSSASSLLLSSVVLSDTQVYEPYIRALLGTEGGSCCGRLDMVYVLGGEILRLGFRGLGSRFWCLGSGG